MTTHAPTGIDPAILLHALTDHPVLDDPLVQAALSPWRARQDPLQAEDIADLLAVLWTHHGQYVDAYERLKNGPTPVHLHHPGGAMTTHWVYGLQGQATHPQDPASP